MTTKPCEVRCLPGLDPDPDVIRKIEEVLELAKRGGVIAIGIVTQHADGSVGTVFHTGPATRASTWALLGGTNHLARRINDWVLDDEGD